MNNYNNAFVEVYEILEYLDYSEYSKIPEEVINAIRENRNHDYEFYFNASKSIREQNILPETKAILFNLFRDYLATPNQHNKILEMQIKDRIKEENTKKLNYEINIFDKNTYKETNENMKLIQCKECIFDKIIKFIRKILKSKE